jgi:arylsulfatase A
VGEIIGFSSQIVVSEAMDWLNAKKDDNPFFLEICFHEPHVPIASPPELVEKYLPLAINHYQAEYFANVENVDIAVGRMIEYLKKNISGETLVIFTSDNGPETLFRYDKAFKSYGSSGELKGHKLWTNEAGFRVPCIINNLGNNKFTGTSDAVVSALDFMPTFCELADAKLPQNKLDGISVAKFLKTGNLNRKKPLIWTFYNAVNDHVVAMRLGDWKIMAKLKSGEEIIPKYIIVNNINEEELKNAKLTDFILYNLKNDISETTDVSLQNQKVLMKLKKRFQKEYAELTADSYVWRR